MNQRRPIRLSTMEIVLIATLFGSLLLTFYQAWQEDQRRNAEIEHEHEH